MSSKNSIFISHSSGDIEKVRRVRNILEVRGASPLLFHLLSLQHPDDFWPLIQKEIAARSTFLYCDSVNARNSLWVKRERKFIEGLAKTKRIKIIEIDLDHPLLASPYFIDKIIFPVCLSCVFALDEVHIVLPFLDALRDNGLLLDIETNFIAPLCSSMIQEDKVRYLRELQTIYGPTDDGSNISPSRLMLIFMTSSLSNPTNHRYLFNLRHLEGLLLLQSSSSRLLGDQVVSIKMTRDEISMPIKDRSQAIIDIAEATLPEAIEKILGSIYSLPLFVGRATITNSSDDSTT